MDGHDKGVRSQAEQLGNLFGDFHQLDARSAKKYQGTGLGLALTKRLAEALGGRVSVHSTPGEGSTFSATLPRVMTMVPADDVGPLVGEPTGNRTVLVVDDDPKALRLADAALRELGYQALCRANAEDARLAAEAEDRKSTRLN